MNRQLNRAIGRRRIPLSVGRKAMNGRSRYVRYALPVSLAFLVAAAAGVALSGQGKPAPGEWPNITGGDAATRYSSLDQVNAANFNTLKVAWEWRGNRDAGIDLGKEITARSL